MTTVFIPAWGEDGADTIVKVTLDIGVNLTREIMLAQEYIFPDRESADKRARELMARDDITWPIYVYERELEWDPFSVD